MKKTDTRAFVPPLPLARPVASRTQAFRATALREVRRRPPTVVRPGMFVPHFSQRRTVSRGACICSSASRSRRRFPTAAAAPPAPALPIARWRTCSIVAAPFGRPTATHDSVACSSGRVVHFPYHCGTLRPTDRDAHRATAPRSGRTPATHYSVACSSGREVHFPYRCGTLRLTDRDVHRATALRGSRTPAAGFAPPTRHARPLIFSPHATYRRLISSYKFLLSPSLLPVAAPIALRSARSAIVLRAPGRFAPHSFPLHGGEVPTGLFFIFRFCPSSPLRPPPFRHPPPWRCPVRRSAAVPHDPPPRSPRNPDCAAVCPHPFTPFIPPIARAPRL